jgi:exopolysaccharide biosynthesis polyprenyl glycosylphosphotransferase
MRHNGTAMVTDQPQIDSGRGANSGSRRFHQLVVLVSGLVALLDIAVTASLWIFTIQTDLTFGLGAGIFYVAWLTLHRAYGESIFASDSLIYSRAHAASASGIIVLLVVWLALNGQIPQPMSLIQLWVFGTVSYLMVRFGARRLGQHLVQSSALKRRAIVLGTPDETELLMNQYNTKAPGTYDFVGLVSPEADLAERGGTLAHLGNVLQLGAVLEETKAEVLFVTDPALLRQYLESDRHCLAHLDFIRIYMTTGSHELLPRSISIHSEALLPMIQFHTQRASGIHLFIKTVLDYLISLTFILVFSPLLALLLLVVALDSRGPLIYRRRVVGRGRREFDAFKFRTMYVDGDKRLSDEQREELATHGKLRGNDPRVTRMGKVMRKLSLDELPQLINVLRGEMSLIGPRMCTLNELDRFGRLQATRQSVKPGITGLWQVSGRSEHSYDGWIDFDIYYVRNYTIWLDLKILAKTIPTVLFGKGAY